MARAEEIERAAHLAELGVAAWRCVLRSRGAVGALLAAAGVDASVEVAALEVAVLGACARAARAGIFAKNLRRADADGFGITAAATWMKSVGGRRTGSARLIAEIERLREEATQEVRAFAEANLRLVVSIARRYVGVMSLEDLVQLGSVGLVKAIHRFDHRRGTRFITYATFWVKSTIFDAFADPRLGFRVPPQLLHAALRARKVADRLEAVSGEPTTVEALLGKGLSKSAVKLALDARLETVSIDEPVGREGSYRLGDNLVDSSPNPEEASALVSSVVDLRRLVEDLPERERLVLKRRFGIGAGGEGERLADIASDLGISRERVRQIEVQALGRLRRRVAA